MSDIHPTAIIGKDVQLAQDVQIGPYCIVEDKVIIDSGTILQSHVVIVGNTSVGKNNIIYPFTTIGKIPQDKKYSNEESYTVIGDNNQIRENVTINRGTANGGNKTVVGNKCLLMASTHIAHDCLLGDNVIMANCSALAGHVIVEDNAIIGGLVGIHQFCYIGTGVMIGGMSRIRGHIWPFSLFKDDTILGANIVGLKRLGKSRDEINQIKEMLNLLSKSGNLNSKLDEIKKYPFGKMMSDFAMRVNNKIGFSRFYQSLK